MPNQKLQGKKGSTRDGSRNGICMSVVRFLCAGLALLAVLLLSLPALVLIAPLLIVSGLTRLGSRVLEPDYTPWSRLIDFDPKVGWKPRADLDTFHLADDVFHLTTDSDGWRCKHLRLEDSEVVVIGDSFAWGYGIDEKNFFANLTKRVKVKAIGTVGYTMVQELLWLQKLKTDLAGKLVVWFVFLGNDLYENLLPDMGGYRMPFLRQSGPEEWAVCSHHVSRRKWPTYFEPETGGRDYYGKLAELCSPSFLSERAYGACRYLMEEGAKACREVGAQLAIVTIPEPCQLSSEGVEMLRRRNGHGEGMDVDYPDQRIELICRKLNLPLVSLKQHLGRRHYKSDDCHWNERGHRIVAGLIEDLFREVVEGGLKLEADARKERIHV